MMNNFEKSVFNTIKKYDMLVGSETVTVGLSGGADSTALLNALVSLKNTLNISVRAVHINHMLRDDESDRDEKFAADLCSRLNVPLEIFKIDIRAALADTKMGIEQGAREIRYDIFAKSAGQDGVIATAHNLNDTAETLIFNIARGSGINGLCSIPPKRDRIIRPLIESPRCEIERYLSEIGCGYVTDSSNLTDDYTRNRIRHNVMPTLCEINPAFLKSVMRLNENARLQTDYITRQAKKLIDSGASAVQIAGEHSAVIRSYIYERCRAELGITPEQKHITAAERIILNAGGKCQLAGGYFLWVENGRVSLGIPEADSEPFCIKLGTGRIDTGCGKYECALISRREFEKNKKIYKLLFKNIIDYAKIGKNPVIRSKNDGDRIKLFGRGCTKSLHKLFIENKIPRADRLRVAVICGDDGPIWVEGFGVSESAAVSENTETMLLIQPLKNKGADCY